MTYQVKMLIRNWDLTIGELLKGLKTSLRSTPFTIVFQSRGGSFHRRFAPAISPEALLWTHRFASCNAILSWDKEEAARPACVPPSSEIPFSSSESAREKDATMRSADVLECKTSEYRRELLGMYPLPIPVHAIFQKESRGFLESHPSNSTHACLAG